MRSIILSVVVVSACSISGPEPLCDREAVEWDKWGTVELPAECLIPPVVLVLDRGENDNDDPTDEPSGPNDDPSGKPDGDDPTDEPKGVDKPKGKDDNSDANGKGGNKHDRDDKDRAPQEIAEGKKG